jgi:hypothetical protein
MAQVHTPLTPPNQVLLEISQATSDALCQALAKNPAERFLSYDEFIMAFEAARSLLLRQQAEASQQTEPKRTTSWWRRK